MAKPDPAWREAFEAEARRLTPVFGENLVKIHHIGSTAIPGLAAKPVIDMLPEVGDIRLVDALNDTLQELGYGARGEFGLPGRRFFTRDVAGRRTYNVHVYERGNPEVGRHLAFRDYMITHPKEALAYGHLKVELARRYPLDFEAYMDGKDAFVTEMERRALAWQRTMNGEEQA